MNDKEYRKHPALAQSDLRDLVESSPLHFYFKRYDERYVKEETPALKYGHALHTIALEESLFLGRYLRELEIDRRSNANKEKHTELETQAKQEGKTILPHDVWDSCHELKKELDANPVFQDFKQSSLIEQPIFFEVDGVKCKAKLDIVNVERGFICDFKSTLNAGDKFEREIYTLGYNKQQAWYREAARQQYGVDFRCYMFAQEKEPPYAYGIYEISPTGLEIGWQDMQLAVNLFKLYETQGYPTYNGGQVRLAEPPAYILRNFE